MLRMVLAAWAFGWMLLGSGVAFAGNEHRYALVIGNDTYQTIRPQLANAAKDARDIGAALTAAGFDTSVKVNVKRRELYQLIDEFSRKISGMPDAVGLFYYAGHGIQSNGKNYLIPVDAEVASDEDLEAEAVDAGRVLRAMDEARNRINIVILDACRDNPLPKSRSFARGLTTMQAPRGTFIGYAAAPGQTAQDGTPGSNGIFTGELKKELTVPGLQIEDLFKRVIARVQQDTGGKQMPWMESSLQGTFYFLAPKDPPAASAPAPAAASGAAAVSGPAAASAPRPAAAAAAAAAATASAALAIDAEIVFWQSIASSTIVADFEEYLRQYPQGRFAGLARNRIAALHAAALRATATPAAAPAPPVDEDSALWKVAMNSGDVQKYEEYLQKYPHGHYADVARLKISALMPSPSLPAENMARSADLCGRSIQFSVDRSASSDPFRGLLGAWTGVWNDALGLCGVLIVSKLLPGQTAEVSYIHGPDLRAGALQSPTLQWQRRQTIADIKDGVLKFRDEQGNAFSFAIVDQDLLQARLSGNFGQSRADFRRVY